MAERILVVGGNAAGMTAASRAKRLDPSLSVTILEASPRIAYSICGVPFAVSGRVREIEDLVLFTPETLQNERGIEARVNVEAVEILPSRRSVVAVDRASGRQETVPYDKLLLATGYRLVDAKIEGLEARGIFRASRLDDGEAILAWLSSTSARRAVILGAGYVGLEMAEALVERGLEVTLLERGPRVLGSLDGDMAELVEAELGRKGVRVLKRRDVERFQGDAAGRVEAVELATGSLRLPAEIVFVDVGVAPRVELAVRSGARLGPSGAIAVTERMETTLPAVYAAGNCAETLHLVSGESTSIPLGTVAAKQGRVAGDNLAGRRTRFAGAVGTSIVRVFGVTAASTGLNAEEAARHGFRTLTSTIEGRFQAHYFDSGAEATVKVVADRESGRLLGAQIVGSREGAIRIDVMATAITARMTVEEASQLDLAYAPSVGALWSPLLVAMNGLLRQL